MRLSQPLISFQIGKVFDLNIIKWFGWLQYWLRDVKLTFVHLHIFEECIFSLIFAYLWQGYTYSLDQFLKLGATFQLKFIFSVFKISVSLKVLIFYGKIQNFGGARVAHSINVCLSGHDPRTPGSIQPPIQSRESASPSSSSSAHLLAHVHSFYPSLSLINKIFKKKNAKLLIIVSLKSKMNPGS